MLHGESDYEYQDEDFMKSPPVSELEHREEDEDNENQMFDDLDDFFDE